MANMLARNRCWLSILRVWWKWIDANAEMPTEIHYYTLYEVYVRICESTSVRIYRWRASIYEVRRKLAPQFIEINFNAHQIRAIRHNGDNVQWLLARMFAYYSTRFGLTRVPMCQQNTAAIRYSETSIYC